MIEVRPGGRRRIDRVLAPGYVADLDALDLAEVRARRDDAAQEETDLSYLRRLLHGRIDIVLAEQKRRHDGEGASVVEQLATILSDKAVAATGSGRHQVLEPSRAEAHRRHVEALVSDADLSDVSALPDDRLDLALRTYRAEEASVSQRRREVQQVVDLLNEQIGNRYRAGSASVDDLLAAERQKRGQG
ncbi:RsiG family protein [Actinokineospora bangkokensis]|uniref:Aerial mycelium formation protein n=1 Tax=Actinokineospora bangkokensis TaxID=1193682 RepID=A0A1Q9LFN6_9PSEU|nr:aerial mycelium formation protein [Actinokineospora bangkokensis]OLR90857.1 aerial mycelium formation protein [Actinokineospora bangkokensis]